MNNSKLAQRVRDFWFGMEGSDTFGKSRPEWFKKDPVFDDAIRAAFLDDVNAAIDGDLDALGADNPQDCLALLILLDQFPRNLFRGDGKSFAGDGRALNLAKAAIDKGFDAETPLFQRFFFYLPFEHSENMADQERCVELVRAQNYEDLLKWAIAHRDIIARFGRFPHRNAVLGRTSTAEEIEFLTQPNSSF
ncbi:MAG: DUF924 domain-containing protein [Rhodospirillaceae bacterium]|nr:DUF924 domain-containing protein [Rhodospirillaceae bacterium]